VVELEVQYSRRLSQYLGRVIAIFAMHFILLLNIDNRADLAVLSVITERTFRRGVEVQYVQYSIFNCRVYPRQKHE
jgi:hypothetical protein